jgi:Spy/CpxP family protein refolding chaperone
MNVFGKTVKKSCLVLLAWVLILSSLGVLTVNAATERDKAITERHKAHEQQMEVVMKKAGLSAQQIQQVKSIKQKAKPQAEALKHNICQKHQALETYLKASNAREEQANTLQAGIDQLVSQLSNYRIKTWFQIRQVMTLDQFKKFVAYKSQMKMKGGLQHSQYPYCDK